MLLNVTEAARVGQAAAAAVRTPNRELILEEAVRQLTEEVREIEAKHEARIADLRATFSGVDRAVRPGGVPNAELIARLTCANRIMAKALDAQLNECGRGAELGRYNDRKSPRATNSSSWIQRRVAWPILWRINRALQAWSAAESRRAFDRRLIEASGLFDPSAYLAANPDVASAGLDPLSHYLQYGGAEGRAAGPQFNSREYLDGNPDVGVAGINPLVHYLQYGIAEGRMMTSVGDLTPVRV